MDEFTVTLYTPEKNSKYRIINVLKTTSNNKWYQFTSLSSSEISLDELKESLKAGALLYATLERCTTTGMSFFVCQEKGECALWEIMQAQKKLMDYYLRKARCLTQY